jgi:tripartite-type tricarboxylate transporter receptor subunit TctC
MMKTKRRIIPVILSMSILLMTAACANTLAFAASAAEPSNVDWPKQAIQVFVTTSAGGSMFLDANKIGSLLTAEWGVPIIINAMPGAGGTIAMRHVLDSVNDGYTMLFCQSGVFSTHAMGVADFDYSAFEFGGIAIEDDVTAIFAKPDQFPDFQSLVDYSRKNPGEVIWGTVMGGLTHMLGLSLTDALDIEWTVADIGDVAETTTAIIAGDCHINMASIPSLIPYMEAGTLKPLLIFGKERSAAFPDVPCVSEYADISFAKLSGFYLPKGTNPAIVKKLSDAVEKVVGKQEFKNYCKETYVEAAFYGSQEGLNLLAEQQKFFKRAVEQMNKDK